MEQLFLSSVTRISDLAAGNFEIAAWPREEWSAHWAPARPR